MPSVYRTKSHFSLVCARGRKQILAVRFLYLVLSSIFFSQFNTHQKQPKGDNMRKILLATTALVGFVAAGAAQAAPATSPVTVNVGGSVDFVAGAFHEAAKSQPVASDLASSDFETLYDLDFSVAGKSNNGIQYGGLLSLNNNSDISNSFNGQSDGLEVTTADLFLSGAFGKVQLGDSHGATDLALTAPTVGEGQVEGRYVDFLDTSSFAKNFVYGVDVTDHSTNITYFTPKVGNESNKVQVAVSYIPNFYNYGSSIVHINNDSSSSTTSGTDHLSPYKDVVKGAINYTGNIAPVAIAASAHIITGTADQSSLGNSGWLSSSLVSGAANKVQDFTAWGLGAQAALNGFTFGVTYLDQGHYDMIATQTKDQHQYAAGLKYEFSKYAVGASYLGGEGYDNMLNTTINNGATGNNLNYVKNFNTEGLGGAYSWAPGLTTNLDGVLFQQDTEGARENDGYVLLVSQKLAF